MTSSRGLRRSLELRLERWPHDLTGILVPARQGLARHVETRPARQVLYPPGDISAASRLVDPQKPRYEVTRYRGRVDEYDTGIQVAHVSLWAEPSGQESMACLPLADFPGELRPPQRDFAFFFWTWLELDGAELISRYRIEPPGRPAQPSERP